MNKKELLDLAAKAAMTPKEIEAKDGELFKKINTRASISLKNTIESKLKDASNELKESFKTVDINPGTLGDKDARTLLIKNLIERAERATPENKKELEEMAAKLPNLGKLNDIVQPDLPMIANPAFHEDLAKAKLYRLGEIAGLKDKDTEKVMVKNVDVVNMSKEKLDELVNDKVIDEKESTSLGLTSNLLNLFDYSFELTDHVMNNIKPASVDELADISKDKWLKLVKDSKTELPKDVKAEDYAELLYKKVENLFPETFLVKRVSDVDTTAVTKGIKTLKTLLDQNEKAFGLTSFEELKKDGLTEAEINNLRSVYEDIDRVAKTHPGLKIDEIINDKNTSTDNKGKLIKERIGLLETFSKNNEDIDFLSLDYRHDSDDIKQLKFDGLKAEEKKMVLNSVKSYQRIYSVTNDIENTEKLLSAGFHSSYQIASVTLPDFIKVSKLNREIATRYYENAHMAMIRTTGIMGSVIDIVNGSFNWTGVGNAQPEILNYLRDIPGYQDLFGSLAFCDCEHCQSIYSPAAYFVDMMQFVDKHVTTKYFSGAAASHVLNLKTRRPDLWTLALTCENTSTLVPYLDIINTILETYIAKKKGFAGNLADRNAVEGFVYKQEIALEKGANWKNEVFSFKQPFHLPLASVVTYLRHFEKTREDIGILFKRPQLELSKARLNISEKKYELITTVDATPAFIQRAYGITFAVAGGKITPFDAQELLPPLGVKRKELEKLLKSSFVTKQGTDNIIIQGERKDATSIQNDIERIKNLTYDALDRLHRFTRLWKKTNLSIEEFDLLLTQIRESGIASELDNEVIKVIGYLLQLQERLKINFEDLSALWYKIPVAVLKEKEKSFFDRLFNHEDVVTTEGAYPKDTTLLIHPALIKDKSTVPGEFSSGRLMAALNKSDDEVFALIKYLQKPLGIVNIDSATESDRGFLLTLVNLSLLYRHSRLADLLNLSIDDLFRLAELHPDLPNDHVENTEHIFKLLNFYQWTKSSGYSVDDLNFILETGKVVTPEDYKTKEELTATILEQTKTSNSLYFADTLFAQFEDINEGQSKAILQANSTIYETGADGRLLLKKEYDPTVALTIPAGIMRLESDFRDVLTKYHPQYLIPYFLSGPLNMNETSIAKIITALGIDLDADPYTLELQEVTDPAVALPALVDKLLPLSVLFKDKKFIAPAIEYILSNLNLFGIADIDNVTIENVQQLRSFLDFIVINEDATNNVDLLKTVFMSFVAATQYQTADQEKLSTVLGTKPEMLPAINAAAVAQTTPTDALAHYKKLAEVTGYIGVGADILLKIISVQYDELAEASQGLLAAFRSKYKSEQERKEKLEKYQDILRGKKRASLTTYLTHSGFPQFKDEDDLFHYFLIDTELEGCARTSPLVAATMSLQLYIHRILLNLEQDRQPPGTPGRLHVLASDIPEDEWVWRKNYRVWEANRKVFLYPENYIEPDLRDDKTPLFKELESELLQKEINADNVLDAYGKYMRGFDEVAHLKIAGCYHELNKETETDVLHLFGVTADDPPLYYYRRVENLYYAEKRDDRGIVWEPWEKITVQIPVKKVAPITYNGRLHVFWVKVTSLANSVFDDNRSIFIGYSHKYSIEFTTLKLDGSWTPPQKLVLKECYPFEASNIIQDPLADQWELAAFTASLHDALRSFPFFNFSGVTDAIRKLKTPRFDTTVHYEPNDDYTLSGKFWEQVYPSVDSSNRLILSGAMYQMRAAIDFYNLTVKNAGSPFWNVSGIDPAMENVTYAVNKPGKIILRSGNGLYRASSPGYQLFDNYAYGSLIINTTKSNELLTRHWAQCTLDNSFNNIMHEQIGGMPAGSEVQVVNGIYSDAIIDAQGDLLLLQGSTSDRNDFLIKRIGTTLSETLTRTLFTSGVETTLSIETQKALKEAVLPITITANRIKNLVVSNKIDFKGAYGDYFREIFFQIPFLLANHLNSQGKYAEAQKWYHYIFNPSATEVIDVTAPGLTAEQKKKMELDRNWQYIEFRNLDAQKLRDQLEDKQAIEVYKKDPFNPHAIARLRLSAYQKCIVMKYIDNLLDWGDQLFTQDTMESVNEATLLYIIAKEILGNRPAEIGDCGEGNIDPKNYETIQPSLSKGSEFLAELESYTIVKTPTKGKRPSKKEMLDNRYINEKAKKVFEEARMTKGVEMKSNIGNNHIDVERIKEAESKYVKEIPIKAPDDKFTGAFSKGVVRPLKWKRPSIYVRDKYKLPSFGWSIIRHVSPVFCVPGNKDLLQYYDRVDDRLYKIRNCMNIQGQRRQLALFAPEIDPRLLVRARAAGLSLDDILNSMSGNLPPYRFAYLLERAKGFTSIVQGFGSSLFSAMEKKNSEELNLLRMKQQKNILELSKKSRQLEIDSANEGIKALNDRIASLSYQIEYYQSLAAENLNPNERAQQIFRHTATAIHAVELPLGWLAGTLYLIPQAGSPFAMKYGGLDLGGSADKFMKGVGTLATISDSIASSAGLEAGFDRRNQGWRHQTKLLQSELAQTQKTLLASEMRRDILIEAQKIYDRTLEHHKEVMDFYGEKFTNLGLYTWLSTTMQRIYKEAFNNALSIAKLAQQAFQFERDDLTMFIEGNYFESSKAGLLAGEQLLLALQSMEKKYIETNYRKNEIDQSFSLTQLNPAALLELKQTGSCNFSINEIFFDLFYPGQYKRKIQSVRLTIPSITGPYTNISATLSLSASSIRMEPKLGAAELKEVPKSRTTIISTSTAQNDAGVFQLNFRDERYMPFEGAGAISTWKLSLPKTFRQFDYSTINDVIVHISYTAEYDELFRDNVEAQNDAIEGTLLNVLKNKPLSRVMSLRQEFSTDFHRLTEQGVNQPVTMKIQNKHFPLFMNGRNIKITKAKLVLVTPPGQTVAGVNIAINGNAQNGFAKDGQLGDLFSKDMGTIFNAGILKDHTLSVLAGGDLAGTAPAVGPTSAFDTQKLEDIVLYVEYKMN